MLPGLSFRAALVSCLLTVPAEGQAPQAPARTERLPHGALLRMGSTRLAHANWFTSLQFSPDDRLLGAADADGVVRLWDTATGQLMWEKPKRSGGTLAFSPDGNTLAIGGYYQNEIVLWDLHKNEALFELPQNARALDFSKDGTILAAAGADKIVRLWNTTTGKVLHECKGHESELFAVAFSPEGDLLASGGGSGGTSHNNEIRLWDPATGKEVAELDDDNQRLLQLPDAVYSLAFSPDGKTLGAGGAYVVRLWDVPRRKVAHRLENCSYDVAFSPNSKSLVAAGEFGIYDLASGEIAVKLAGNVGVYACVDYSHNGKLIASGNKEGYIQLWNATTGKEILLRKGHEGGIRAVAFSPDGTVAASVSREDATIRIWGTASGTQLLKIPVTWTGPDVWWSEEGSHVAFAPYGRELLTWTHDAAVRYWKPDDLESRTLQLGTTRATAMAFSHDGTLGAVVEYDGGSRIKIALYELDGGRSVTSLDPFDGKSGSDPWISSLAFSPDKKKLAVGVLGSSLQETPSPSVQIWDLKREVIERRIRPAVAPPGHVCFSPDGSLLATSPTRGAPLQLWRTSDGNEVRSFKLEADAHGRDPAPIAFAPDSKRLAAADANRDIYVWELTVGDKVRTFQGHQKAVTSLAISPDGKTLLSGSEDATMLLWDLGGAARVDAVLTPQQLSDYWDALADSDAGIAADAAKALLSAQQAAMTLFTQRLTAGEAPNVEEIPKLIADLSGDDVKANLKAAARLKSFGSRASSHLFKALAARPPLAARKRLEEVLQAIGEFPVPPEALQRTRAIQLLEQIGSHDARNLLVKLAQTEPPTAASLDAKAALQRLELRLRAPKIGSTSER
jgi:WD40 repeat protein